MSYSWLVPIAGFAAGVLAEVTRAHLHPVGNKAYDWFERIHTSFWGVNALLFFALFLLDALVFIAKQLPLLLIVMGSSYTVTGVSAQDLVQRTHTWSWGDAGRGIMWLAFLIVGYRVSRTVRERKSKADS